MHEDITRFSETGTIKSEAYFLQTKQAMNKVLEDKMYDTGYLPVVDLQPHWTLMRNDEEDLYEFCFSIFGVYVGEENVRECVWSDGRAIRTK